MRKLASCLFVIGWCLFTSLFTAVAQSGCPAEQSLLRIGPSYLDNIDGGNALGLSGTGRWCRAAYDTRPRLPRALYVGIEADGVVPFTRLRLPDNVQGSAWMGYTVSLTERAEDTGGDLDEEVSAFRFNYGVMAVGGRFQYESSTDFEEQALSAGMELRWVHHQWRLAPSLVASINAVLPLASAVRDAVGANNKLHGRAGLRAYWLIPLAGFLEGELDGRYFTGFGMDEVVAATGIDEGAFVSAGVGFVIGQAIGSVQLDRLYLGYSHGRQPTESELHKAWTVGLRVSGR